MSALLCAIVSAAQTEIKVQTRDLVAVDEVFNVVFTIESDKPSSFQWEPGSDFQLVWGPQKGSSTSVSMVNGKVSKSSTYTYTYTLQAIQPGQFTLEPAQAVIDGRTVNSRSVTVTVVSGGQQAQPQAQGSQARETQPSQTQDSPSDDIFLSLVFSKKSVVVGESLNASLIIYQRADIAGFEDVKFPVFHGFWSQETYAPNNIEWHRENVGGKIYNAATLRSYALVAQRSGDISVEPAELVCVVNVRRGGRRSGSIFDDFFQDDYTRVRRKVSTRPVTLHVSPLPAGAPASFCGGVGKFSVSASLTRDSLSVHDASTLVVKVKGDGNLSLTDTPKLSFPPDFETYDVKVTDSKGEKTFEYPFIPRSKGNFVIAPVEYSYYDLQAGRYVSVKTEAMPIQVTKGNVASSVSSGDGALLVQDNRRSVKDLGTDIRYIATAPDRLRAKGSFFVFSPAFFSVLALLVVVAGVLGALLRRAAVRRADTAGSRNRAAAKLARRRLERAAAHLKGGDKAAFYEELHKALTGFISDKFLMDASELSRENISQRLAGTGVAQQTSEKFIALLDECEYARYAPSALGDDMNARYESAVEAISEIEQCMKKKHGTGAPLATLLLLSLLLPSMLKAGEPADSLWAAASAAYAEGRYGEALEDWKAVEASGLVSPGLYTNIGDACFKLDDLAGAVLAYERALKLDPSDASARYNLEFVSSQLQDRIDEVPEFFLRTWYRRFCNLLSSDAWAVLFLLFFAILLFCILLFLLSSLPPARKTGFFCGIAALLLCIVCISAASYCRNSSLAADRAVIMSPVVSASSSPASGSSSRDLFVLHEGTRVKLLESIGGWSNVELSDGRQGWVESSEIEII